MRFFFFLIFFSFSLNTFAQIESAYPANYATDFESITMATNGQGFAGGSCGILIKTTNNGSSWLKINSPTTDDISQIACRPGTGCQQVFISAENTVYRSLDGGQSWNSNDIGSTASAKSISFPDAQTVVIGRIITSLSRSTNNGESFEPIFAGNAPATKTEFVAADRAFFFSNQKKLVTTTDGGDTWNDIYTHEEGIRGMDFLSASIGFMYNASGILYKTSDGGLNWIEVGSLPDIRFIFRELEAVTESRIEILSSRSLWRSMDGGVTFEEVFRGNSNGAPFSDIALSRLVRQNDAYWVASSATSILYSSDNMETVTEQISGEREQINALDLSGDFGYAITANYSLLKTNDAGLSWSVLQPIANFIAFRDILTLSENEVVTCGNGSPDISTDGGLNFNEYLPASIPNQGAIQKVERLDNGRILFAGNSGAVYSDNNGQSWTNVPFDIESTVLDMTTNGELVGVINNQDQIMYSTNSGSSWTASPSVPDGLTNDHNFYMIDATTWLIGTVPSGTVYRTTDAGQNWVAIDDVRAHYFEQDAEGRVFGIAGRNVLLSRDQGENWEVIQEFCSDFGLPFSEIIYEADLDEMFIYGRGMRIYRIAPIDVISSSREISTPAGLQLYPNPTSDQIFVELEPELYGENIQLELWNSQGQLVMTTPKVASPQLAIDCNDYPSGIYLLRLNGKGWLKTGRVIIQ